MILALHGRARSGKDTVGRYLEERHGFTCISFADPIRAAMRAAFELTDWHFDAGKEIPLDGLGKSPRQLMQLFGTEFGRNLIHPDCWLIVSEHRCYGVENLVVTDCRFPNEAEWARARGGFVLEIVRPNAPAVAAHSSEDGLPKELVDVTVRNTGSFNYLYNQIDWALEMLGERE
jgi:hypothetical protein